ARHAGRGLGLPVEQLGADRVVAVSRGRREALAGLVERDEQELALPLELQDPTLERDVLLAGLDEPDRSGDLAARVVPMQRERPRRNGIDLLGDPDAILEHLAELVELADDRRPRREVRDGLLGGAQRAA